MERGYIRAPNAIIKELIRSKLNGTVIGITSPALGAGMFLTAVEDILIEGEKSVVVLKHFDINGYFFSTHQLTLDQVAAVCPFRSKFENPFLSRQVKLTESRI